MARDDLLHDGLERLPVQVGDAALGYSVQHRLVNPPKHTRFERMNRGNGLEWVEVPHDVTFSERLREALTDAGFLFGITLGVPLALVAVWVVISYVLMMIGWIVGAGDLHPFPELLLIPESCWPNTGPC